MSTPSSPKRYHCDPSASGVFYVARRDAECLSVRGYVSAGDYVPLPSSSVVWELDPSSLESRPVGFVSSPEYLKYVARKPNDRDALIRPGDLLGIRALARRTRRKAGTVQQWVKAPDFPQRRRIVNARVWYWPEVLAWMQARGLPVRRKESR